MSSNVFKNHAKKILPIVVILAFVGLALIVKSNPPQTARGQKSQLPQLNVDVKTLAKGSFPILIDSYGTVKPRTQSVLLPQVSGQIIRISDKFQAGSFFEKGDVLIELDDRDLRAEVKIAQGNLYNAKQMLSEELARVEQAKQDWQRLGNSDVAPDLVMRKPQLLAAEAKVLSSEASLEKAQLAVERTKIIAPYAGRILSKDVDLGQVISPNTRLAQIYAVDYVEIRLPLKNKDLPYMVLPESNRFEQASDKEQPVVTVYSDLAKRQTWFGKVVRTEGSFDQNSQQLFVVAQIDDPYGVKTTEGLALKIGQYVSVKIKGRVVDDVITIPNKAIYQGSYVYIVEDGVLKRQEIELAWQNDDIAIIETGLVEGQLLVLTPLGQVTSGTRVAINKLDDTVQHAPIKNGKGKRADKERKSGEHKRPVNANKDKDENKGVKS